MLQTLVPTNPGLNFCHIYLICNSQDSRGFSQCPIYGPNNRQSPDLTWGQVPTPGVGRGGAWRQDWPRWSQQSSCKESYARKDGVPATLTDPLLAASLGNTDVILFSFFFLFFPASLCQNLSNILSDTFHHVINTRYHFEKVLPSSATSERHERGEEWNRWSLDCGGHLARERPTMVSSRIIFTSFIREALSILFLLLKILWKN